MYFFKQKTNSDTEFYNQTNVSLERLLGLLNVNSQSTVIYFHSLSAYFTILPTKLRKQLDCSATCLKQTVFLSTSSIWPIIDYGSPGFLIALKGLIKLIRLTSES